MAAQEGNNAFNKFQDALTQLEGAFSIIAFINDKMIIVRDPSGYRPLCIGKFETGYAVASESCALDMIGATEIRDVEPGEVIILDKTRAGLIDELKAHLMDWDIKQKFCIFTQNTEFCLKKAEFIEQTGRILPKTAEFPPQKSSIPRKSA